MVKYDIKESDIQVVYDSVVTAHKTLVVMEPLPARFKIMQSQLMSLIGKLAEDLDAFKRRAAMEAIRTKKVDPATVIRMGVEQNE